MITPKGPASSIQLTGCTKAPQPMAEPSAIAHTQCGFRVLFNVVLFSIIILHSTKTQIISYYIIDYPPFLKTHPLISKPVLHSTRETLSLSSRNKTLAAEASSQLKILDPFGVLDYGR